MKTILSVLFLCAAAHAAEPQSTFNIQLLSPVSHTIVPVPLHWHFYGGNVTSIFRKKMRQAMKDAGHVEDLSGNVGIARFGKGETLFLLYPKLDGCVFILTDNENRMIEASLVFNTKTKSKYAYALMGALASKLIGGVP